MAVDHTSTTKAPYKKRLEQKSNGYRLKGSGFDNLIDQDNSVQRIINQGNQRHMDNELN